jgi:uncharacterized membrane protein YagU involved in acid resistance
LKRSEWFLLIVLGGLVGTPAMTALTGVLAPVLGVNPDIVAMLGGMLGSWKIGMLVHFLNGAVIFPVAFAFLFSRFLPGPLVAKGIAFGVLLWLTSQLVVMPMMGAGFFSAHIGGMNAVAASLLGHVLYGSSLGIFPGLVREDLRIYTSRV